MAEKTTVANIASVGIIYRESDPSTIFIDIKDGGYPIRAFRWMMCPIGGNWIGNSALNDLNPRDTFCRELFEELSLDKQAVSTEEAALLGLDPEQDSYIVPKKDVIPTDKDRAELDHLKKVFIETARPFGDFLVTVPKSVLDQNVPDNTRPGYSALFPYWLVPVKEKDWSMLVRLHEKFGNLSIESIAVIISLDEIVRTRRYTCCGHDLVMELFFITVKGYDYVSRYPLPLLEGISYKLMGVPLNSYIEYLKKYDILRNPFKK